MTEKGILEADDVRRALVRVAHEIVERNHGAQDLLFVGIVTRGVPIARRLGEDKVVVTVLGDTGERYLQFPA